MGEKGDAFLKGGCGCLLAFFVIGFLTLLIGGRVRADLGGLVLLFVIGGVIGLVVLSIYNKGKQDARQPPSPSPVDSCLATPSTCVRCKSPIPAGAVQCIQCGWSYQVAEPHNPTGMPDSGDNGRQPRT